MEFGLLCKNETYRLICWRCDREVELPASARQFSCPYCGVSLTVDWPVNYPRRGMTAVPNLKPKKRAMKGRYL